ncbi:MAG: hypothetical protein HQM04_06525 [Magnetococcales bacterium]|nr:hypothetical protein [Magnetococcales bacterium]MBF0114682.1 hypothetical protein [Magnetococcales bacterium]
MFAKYVYNAAANTAHVLADVVAILTGTSDTATLSASCNKAASSITATVAAGWTLHDVSAGMNAQALKAANADSGYKYVVIDTNTSGAIFTKIYYSWDEGVHSGSNLAYNSDVASYSQRLDLTNGGTLYLFASPRYLLLASSVAAGWGSPTNSGPSGCVERSRACLWDTPTFAFPVGLFISFGYAVAADTGCFAPRKYTSTMATQTGSSASHSLTANHGTLSAYCTAVSNQKVPAPDGSLWVPFIMIGVADAANMPQLYGEISTLCDIWAIPSSVCSNLDRVIRDDNEYICVQASTTSKMIVLRAA